MPKQLSVLFYDVKPGVIYGQWQPMYFEMMDAIPGIEIYDGTPSEID